MGTWDVGPFDNDTAADWCGGLQDAAAGERTALLRRALDRVVADDSEWRALWEESDYWPQAQAVVTSLRGDLAGPAPERR
ncbi:DUF4259 domain-containing protein [Nonomuraea zeae]|uniref:DUF4259 domain-containing protein n=1 Tax=Nonomuraea zeae TaxID=1642303 RepID=A0A5S4G9H1_9ACTN|nr:DUF4259 domain-containing protein [Nonomuraea zeae]TMR29657.1 DUF4259 domain-containing protein [Nonomuraea zeae]